MSLHLDTLREISKYWAGHRLAYTCSALYLSWNPDDHVVVTCNVVTCKLVGCRVNHGSITTSRMPNGAYHGKSVVVEHIVWNDVKNTETVEYDRGQIVSSTALSERAGCFDYYHTATIINGWVCRWSCSDPNMSIGRMFVGITPLERDIVSRDNVPHCDFSAVAHDLIAQKQGYGGCSTLEIHANWNDISLPDTYRWR